MKKKIVFSAIFFLIILCLGNFLLFPKVTNAQVVTTATLSSQGIIILPSSFTIQGADIGENIFCPTALNYHSNIGSILSSMDINTVRLQEGCEGDVWHINMVKNAANDAWAYNLMDLLNTIGSLGLKCYFYDLGDPYGGELGILDPTDGQTPMNIAVAESYINELAGNNTLHYDFLTDPRIVVWSVGNEANIGTILQNGTVVTNSNYQWIIQMCDYIRSLGGKVVVPSPVLNATAYNGLSWDTDFKFTVPLLEGHVDYIEDHIYGISNLINYYYLGNQEYNWVAWEVWMQSQLQEMITYKGNFSINQIILGEFGIWGGNGTDMGFTNWNFTDNNRIDYYTYAFQAIEAVGLRNVSFHYAIDEIGVGTNGALAYSAHYGVVDPSGESYANLTTIIQQNYAKISASASQG